MRRNLRAVVVLAVAGAVMVFVTTRRRQRVGDVEVGFTGDMSRYTDAWVEFASPPMGPDDYDAACRAANAYFGRVSDLLAGTAQGARLAFESAACLAGVAQAATDRTNATVIVGSDGVITDTKARYLAVTNVANRGLGGPQLAISVGYSP